MTTNWSSGYTFPILDKSGNPTTTIVDMSDMFVRKELFLDSGAFGWGWDGYGQVGQNGSTSNYSSPIQVGSLTVWKTIAQGTGQTLGIQDNGTLWGWGYGSFGQLGNNATNSYQSPIQIGALNSWKTVTGGYGWSAGIQTNGTLWTWGRNGNGVLGANVAPGTNDSSPIQVGTATNWKQVAATNTTTIGANTMGGIRTDGTMWTWGNGGSYVLGTGVTTAYSSPVQIGALTTWKQISCGYNFMGAIATNGSIWTWGSATPALGNNSSTTQSIPTQVSTNAWTQISCGYSHTAAVRNDGTLWTWGYNSTGVLGNGTVTNYSSPIQVGTSTNWKQVAAGNQYTIALQTNGTVWAWGQNNFGQLGLGAVTTQSYSSPIQVGSLTDWRMISAAYGTSFAILAPELPD